LGGLVFNLHKGVKWASSGHSKENFSSKINHIGVMLCLKQKQKNPQSKKQTKKTPHMYNVKLLQIVPWNFSPSTWSFLKNYPSVLSATNESLDRRGKEK
jgi:hypothetical protein